MNVEKLCQLEDELHENPPELLSPPLAHLLASYHLLDAAIQEFNRYTVESGKNRLYEEIHDTYASMDFAEEWIALILKRDYGVEYDR